MKRTERIISYFKKGYFQNIYIFFFTRNTRSACSGCKSASHGDGLIVREFPGAITRATIHVRLALASWRIEARQASPFNLDDRDVISTGNAGGDMQMIPVEQFAARARSTRPGSSPVSLKHARSTPRVKFMSVKIYEPLLCILLSATSASRSLTSIFPTPVGGAIFANRKRFVAFVSPPNVRSQRYDKDKPATPELCTIPFDM